MSLADKLTYSDDGKICSFSKEIADLARTKELSMSTDDFANRLWDVRESYVRRHTKAVDELNEGMMNADLVAILRAKGRLILSEQILTLTEDISYKEGCAALSMMNANDFGLRNLGLND